MNKKLFLLFIVATLFISCGDKTPNTSHDNEKNDFDANEQTTSDNYTASDKEQTKNDNDTASDNEQTKNDNDTTSDNEQATGDNDTSIDNEQAKNDNDTSIDNDNEQASDDDNYMEDDSDDLPCDEHLATDDENQICIPAGEVVKDDEICCKGLARADEAEINYLSGNMGFCNPTGKEICIECGNGKCDKIENACNCEKDCPKDRIKKCDDGSIVTCKMAEPVACYGDHLAVAIIDGCYKCVDILDCRDGSCDDGTTPACDMMPPTCEKDEILAYQKGCYYCVDPATCKKNK
ncbi:MAG: hypothetical protein ACOX2F_08410 [bacterium]